MEMCGPSNWQGRPVGLGQLATFEVSLESCVALQMISCARSEYRSTQPVIIIKKQSMEESVRDFFFPQRN
jgi:hypothetical protein